MSYSWRMSTVGTSSFQVLGPFHETRMLVALEIRICIHRATALSLSGACGVILIGARGMSLDSCNQ